MPVDDILVLCVLQSRSDLRGDVPSIIEGAPSIRRRALDQFHGECAHAVSMVDAIDRSDVWMVQRMLEARPRAEKGALLDRSLKTGFQENRARSLGRISRPSRTVTMSRAHRPVWLFHVH